MDTDNENNGQGQDTVQPEVDSNAALKAELESVKNMNSDILTKLNTLMTQQQPVQTQPTRMSKEEFSKLLTDDPQSAIEYALSSKIERHSNDLETKLTFKQQQAYYDEKVERDYPLLNKDKAFTDLVKNETRSLIEDGMSKDAPKLVYRAAKNAALIYDKQKGTKSGSTTDISSESPSNVKRSSESKNLPKNFDRFSKMFGLSDKARERAAENIAEKAKQDSHRKNRG